MSTFNPCTDVNSFIAAAANLSTGDNPPYAKADFLAFYPQFTDKVPDVALDQYILAANACVLESRWHESWPVGMANYIAHFATLYLQMAVGGASSTASQVVSSAQVRGVQSSKSVGDVSVSYDFTYTAGNIQGWAGWKQTQYGLQFASMARLLGKAGVYVW